MNFLDGIFGRLGNRCFQMAYLYSQMREGNIPDIYLQEPKYFEKYAEEIRKLFGEGIVKDDRVAIHVRRGDYVTTHKDFYVNLTETNYYTDALKEFPDNQLYLIFSDDIEWCKNNYFTGIRYMYSEGKTPEEDLKLMAGCKGIIMANSSLSWWGSFLGDANKKVIYPKQWFCDGIQRVGFLKEWIAV